MKLETLNKTRGKTSSAFGKCPRKTIDSADIPLQGPRKLRSAPNSSGGRTGLHSHGWKFRHPSMWNGKKTLGEASSRSCEVR